MPRDSNNCAFFSFSITPHDSPKLSTFLILSNDPSLLESLSSYPQTVQYFPDLLPYNVCLSQLGQSPIGSPSFPSFFSLSFLAFSPLPKHLGQSSVSPLEDTLPEP